MQIAIMKESRSDEARVAATPSTVHQLIQLGYNVSVQSQAGLLANFTDEAYHEAGATILANDEPINAELILKVHAPTYLEEDAELQQFPKYSTVIAMAWPGQNEALLAECKTSEVNLLAMDMVPRISRAQSMDARSSLANVDGYRSVIEAANHFGRFFTGQITAAGRIPPAKVLIIGAGVAGLAAIGTANSLGAQVRAFDTRPEVQEQIASLGAEFLTINIEEEASQGDGYAKEMSQAFIDAEMELFRAQAKEVDIIITTALIPGKPAPKLILADMVEQMAAGSVIVDLAAANGGNCELTQTGKIIEHHGVTIIGLTDLSNQVPAQASQLYGTNIVNLLKLLTPEKDGQLKIDFEDEVIRGVTCVRDGEITFPPPPIQVSAASTPPPSNTDTVAPPAPDSKKSPLGQWIKPVSAAVAALLFGWVAEHAPAQFVQHFTVFLLACVVGYYVVWNVSHSLHTPLMSVTNAISGIIILGAFVQFKTSSGPLIIILATIAVLIATINIVGGFTVTQRMLKMFRKDGD